MKAILIFNIDGTDINDIHFHAIPILESISGKEFKATSDLILRPLPKRKIVLEHRIGGYIVNGIEMTQAHGYNECLDEILGETE